MWSKVMATIAIENVPDTVYLHIEKLARIRGVSVSKAATDLLAEAIAGEFGEAEKRLLAEIRADREAMAKRGVWITDDDIRTAKNEGR